MNRQLALLGVFAICFASMLAFVEAATKAGSAAGVSAGKEEFVEEEEVVQEEEVREEGLSSVAALMSGPAPSKLTTGAEPQVASEPASSPAGGAEVKKGSGQKNDPNSSPSNPTGAEKSAKPSEHAGTSRPAKAKEPTGREKPAKPSTGKKDPRSKNKPGKGPVCDAYGNCKDEASGEKCEANPQKPFASGQA